MKKYRVNVNGAEYEVAIEEITGGAVAPAATAAPAAASAPAPASAPAAEPAPATAPANGEQIKAPMPGSILSVAVAAGDKIKKGQLLLVLEAMKMENDIVSPIDGTVASVHVQKGASVNNGDLLVVIA